MRMTSAQVLSLDGILADNKEITHVELMNCNAGVIVQTNRVTLIGNVRGNRYFLLCGNGRVMDGREFAHLFPWKV